MKIEFLLYNFIIFTIFKIKVKYTVEILAYFSTFLCSFVFCFFYWLMNWVKSVRHCFFSVQPQALTLSNVCSERNTRNTFPGGVYNELFIILLYTLYQICILLYLRIQTMWLYSIVATPYHLKWQFGSYIKLYIM